MSKNNRAIRKKQAEDTIKCIKQGFYTLPNGNNISLSTEQAYAENNTTVYTPEAGNELIGSIELLNNPESTRFEVRNESTMSAVTSLIQEGHKRVACLNFASGKNAGGGFLNGSLAQEESIALTTGLYPCQMLKGSTYYQANRKRGAPFYTDYIIYSPEVPILKDEQGNYKETLETVSIITSPAVNASVLKPKKRHGNPDIAKVMKDRMAKVLAIALHHKHTHLILGAWGCGVFANDPKEIARFFKEVLDTQFPNQFDRVVFAIYSNSKTILGPFQKAFGDS